MKSIQCENGDHLRCNGWSTEMVMCGCDCHQDPEG